MREQRLQPEADGTIFKIETGLVHVKIASAQYMQSNNQFISEGMVGLLWPKNNLTLVCQNICIIMLNYKINNSSPVFDKTFYMPNPKDLPTCI